VPVVGTGVDLVHVPGFAEQQRLPGAWTDRVFTPGERRDAGDRARSLAARWAAKEAFIKAWSESMWGSSPVLGDDVHHEIEVATDAWGRPRIVLHGKVAEAIGDAQILVSLSHDGDYAIAQVVLQRQ